MDDLILTGSVSLIGLYGAALLLIAGAVFILLRLGQAVMEGDFGYIAEMLVGITILLTAYAGTGFWLQKSGRI